MTVATVERVSNGLVLRWCEDAVDDSGEIKHAEVFEIPECNEGDEGKHNKRRRDRIVDFFFTLSELLDIVDLNDEVCKISITDKQD